ncbi:hypothetical protein [Rhizobium sp. BR 249]|uniref:hypothetical protein n=1 Tax=Rhizobium sp. BR 249 TaxID=3040011 RepID=UPI0039BFEF0B
MDGVISQHLDSGLREPCGIAAFYRIAADAAQLRRDLTLKGCSSRAEGIQRAAKIIGLRARVADKVAEQRLRTMPIPPIVKLRSGSFQVFAGLNPSGKYRPIDPMTRVNREVTPSDIRVSALARKSESIFGKHDLKIENVERSLASERTHGALVEQHRQTGIR